MPMDMAKYPKNWREISLRIRERDGNCCKTCGVPNGVYITRSLEDPERWAMDDPVTSGCLTSDGHLHKWSEAPAEFQTDKPPIRVVLTVAHLNHDTTDNCDGNLAALCQLHHLRHDAQQHAQNAKRTRLNRKSEAIRESGQEALF